MDLEQRLALRRVVLGIAACDLRDREAEALCQPAHRVLEPDSFVQLEELEDVAAGSTAETMEEPPLPVHVKRRGLLGMERAESLIARPGLLQRHGFLDHLDDVGLVAQIVEEGLGEQGHDL